MLEQPFLYTEIVSPLLTQYEEIRWFADPEVEATQEGIISGGTTSWTYYLTQEKKLPTPDLLPVGSNSKYPELERMLQSLICFKVLLRGTMDKYDYWVQHQKTDKLSEENFRVLSITARKICEQDTVHKTIEACLIYSDLGKTPTAKRRAKEHGIICADHDDLMKAVFAKPKEIIYKIIPSFKSLTLEVQKSIIATYDAVPLHWGHVTHLEGGTNMFMALLAKIKSGQCTIQLLEQAFIIQASDVAAAASHVDLNGSVSFNNSTYLRYYSALNVLRKLFEPSYTLDAQQILTLLTEENGERLGFTIPLDKRSQVLSRIGAFLRLTTKDSGKLLIAAAGKVLTNDDWQTIETVFGSESGINIWHRNPTYMPTVLLNLFNTPAPTNAIKYERALRGAIWIAEFCKHYSEIYQSSSEPLCFNGIAAIAKSNPDLFLENFDPAAIEFKKPHEPNIKNSFLDGKLTQERQASAVITVARPLDLAKTQQQLALLTSSQEGKYLTLNLMQSALQQKLINKIVWQQGANNTWFPSTIDLNVTADELWQFIRQYLQDSKSLLAKKILVAFNTSDTTQPMLTGYTMRRQITSAATESAIVESISHVSRKLQQNFY